MRRGAYGGWGVGEAPGTPDSPSCLPRLTPVAFLKGLSDKQREEHYFCRDFVRLKKIPTWKETAKGRPCARDPWLLGGGPVQPGWGERRTDCARKASRVRQALAMCGARCVYHLP